MSKGLPAFIRCVHERHLSSFQAFFMFKTIRKTTPPTLFLSLFEQGDSFQGNKRTEALLSYTFLTFFFFPPQNPGNNPHIL